MSFAVTVEFLAETGKIQITRRTHPEKITEISHDPGAADGHAELYFSLLQLLLDAGAPGPMPRSALHVN